MTKYEWKSNMPKPPVEADTFGAVVDSLAEQNGGVRAEDVVAAAADPKSPIFPLFEWDNSKAGESWRLDQARHYLRSLCVVRVRVNEMPPSSNKAFFVAKPEGADRQSYQSAARIMSDSDLRAQVIKAAKKELEAFLNKYSGVLALGSYIPTLAKVIDEMRNEVDQLEVSAKRRPGAKVKEMA